VVGIAFATTSDDALGVEDEDRPLHEAAFARAGVALDHCQWRDPSVRWDRYDLVVVRSVWDYVERLDEFVAWLRRVDALGTLRNPASVIEWNLDKRYLLDLEALGTPVIPTRIASSEDGVAEAAGEFGGEIVVKPVVSAGSRNTGRFRADDPTVAASATRILEEGRAVMVQPSVASVATEGELGAVLFDGTESHSSRKGAILALGGGRLDHNGETITAEALASDQQDVVGQAFRSVDHLVSEGPSAPLRPGGPGAARRREPRGPRGGAGRARLLPGHRPRGTRALCPVCGAAGVGGR
jgi:hypothetical protein